MDMDKRAVAKKAREVAQSFLEITGADDYKQARSCLTTAKQKEAELDKMLLTCASGGDYDSEEEWIMAHL